MKTLKFPVRLVAFQCLKFDGGKEAVIYDQNWNVVSRLPVDDSQLRISNGNHSIKFDSNFVSGKDQIVKLELKTMDEPLPVSRINM